MNWSTQTPQEDGWYWWRKNSSRHATIVHVGVAYNSFSTYGSGSYKLSEVGGEWFGPLQEPGGDAIENCEVS